MSESFVSVIGIKQVDIVPETREGREGFAVVYKDGYRSWSPKAQLESAYTIIPEGDLKQMEALERYITHIVAGMVQESLDGSRYSVHIHIDTVFGNYHYQAPLDDDMAVIEDRLISRFAAELGGHLEFVREWAKKGLIPNVPEPIAPLPIEK